MDNDTPPQHDFGTKDRRQTARLAESVNFQIGYDTYDLSSSTVNLSPNGLLCRVHHAIPVMTKINMALLIPPSSSRGKPKKIRVKGVVVRVTKDIEGLYKIAVFFTDISDSHKKHLTAYIDERLRKKEEGL